MNRINKTSLLLFVAAVCGCTIATAQTVLVVKTTDGSTPKKISLDDIRKITFEGDDMKVWRNDDAQTSVFSMPDVQNITFGDGNASGIADATVGKEALRPVYSDGVLAASGLAGRTADVAVYDVSGRKLFSAADWDGAPISVAALPKGIYIFKVNNQTIKFTK